MDFTLEEQIRRAAVTARRMAWVAPLSGLALAAAFILGRLTA